VTRPGSSTSGEDAGSLTPSDRRRVAIALRLRELRRTAGLNQAQLAERLGITQSMVSKLEMGRSTPTTDTIERLGAALDLPAAVQEQLQDQLAELTIEVETLRVMHRQGGERSLQAKYAAQEAAASVIWNYQDKVVPGLLQTPDYTRAMVPLVAPSLPDLDDLIRGRAERQHVLYDRSKSFRFLLDEAVLRRRVGPSDVLRGQLDRLTALVTALPHVEIRVLPFSARLSRWTMTSFWIYDEVSVGVELQAGTVSIADSREVATYRDLFEHLWAHALEGEAMVRLIRDVDAWLARLA
jgi:transcriptional regulator with XRE-family HTH domain